VRRVAAYRDRLKHEEHPTGEIRVGVFIASDLAAQVFEPDLLSEDVLAAWETPAEQLGNGVDRRPRTFPASALEQDHEVVVALASHLAPAPRTHQDDGRIGIDAERLESLATLDQPAPSVLEQR
jgi:hypothetical protein